MQRGPDRQVFLDLVEKGGFLQGETERAEVRGRGQVAAWQAAKTPSQAVTPPGGGRGGGTATTLVNRGDPDAHVSV